MFLRIQARRAWQLAWDYWRAPHWACAPVNMNGTTMVAYAVNAMRRLHHGRGSRAVMLVWRTEDAQTF